MKGFLLYFAIVLVLTIPIFVSPFVANGNPGAFEAIQGMYAPLCHQLTSRSICYFTGNSNNGTTGTGATIGDCLSSSEFNSTKISIVETNELIGYKFPVCARDIGIYLFMLIGGIAFAVWKKPGNKIIPPAIWFIIALIPIGFDGGGQLIGLWESTNLARLITGAIAGFAIPFYAIPMLNRWLDGQNSKPKTRK